MTDYLSKAVLGRPHPRLPSQNSALSRLGKRIWISLYDLAFERSERFPATAMSAIQERRLLRLIERAKRNVPFYREYLKDVRTIADFRKIAPLTKHDIRTAFEAGRMTNDRLKGYQVKRYTSGSSGVPFVFYHDSNSYLRRIGLYRRLLRWAGHREGPDSVAIWIMRGNIHPESGAVPFTAATPEEIEAKKEALYSLLTDKCAVLHAMASHLVFIADLLDRDGKTFDFKAIISYGETLYPQVREYLERKFHAPIFDYYASQELMNQAHECEVHDGVHASSEWAYIEVLDEMHRPLPPGEEGAVVVTALDNEVMPFIRYSLGDRGYWMKEPCPCGRTLPRLKLIGRSINHYLRLPDGTVGDFISLALPILKRISEILQFQIKRHDRSTFTVLVVPTAHLTSSTREAIHSEMLEYLGGSAQIELSTVDHIPLSAGGKPRAFINLEDDLLGGEIPAP
jgi:phenylacetate-CoA ligase